MSPDRLREILDEVAARSGGILLPEAVLVAASAPDHPLHGRFDWDDETAAHAHRLEQARALIRSVRVEVRTEERAIRTVYYVRNPVAPADESGYVALPRLKTDAELASAALIQEFSRAVAVLNRARDLARALGLEPSVDDLLGQLQRLADEVPRMEGPEANVPAGLG